MNLNTLRLKAAWLLAIPFLWYARPTVPLLAVGGGLAAVGLLLRAWAAGTIRKEADLTTSGPYAFTRNPLYLGSFFIGVGATLAGGAWLWPLAFVLFFVTVYTKTMARETRRLEELFGERFRTYQSAVPTFLPRLTAYRPVVPDASGGFSFTRYKRNREWEAALGAVVAFALLGLKAWLPT